MNIHILVLVIAIALFGVLAFKQMSALILAPLVTIFVIWWYHHSSIKYYFA